MSTSSHSRGHERADHREIKPRWRSLLLAAGFAIAVCEYHNADVVGMWHNGGSLFVVALEGERSTRNVVRNVRRNLANKIDLVLEVCLPPLTKAALERLVINRLTEAERQRVYVLHKDEVTVEFLRSLLSNVEVNSGFIQVISPCLFRENIPLFKLIREGDTTTEATNVTASMANQSQEGGEEK